MSKFSAGGGTPPSSPSMENPNTPDEIKRLITKSW